MPSGASRRSRAGDVVGDANAAVRDRLPEQLGQARAVDPDDPVVRPVGQPRIGARLQRVRAEERIGRDEGRLDVERSSERRLRAGRPDARRHRGAGAVRRRSAGPRSGALPSLTTIRFTTGRASTASALTQPRAPFGLPGRLSRYHQAPSAPRRAASARTIWNCRSGRKRRIVRIARADGSGAARTTAAATTPPRPETGAAG